MNRNWVRLFLNEGQVPLLREALKDAEDTVATRVAGLKAGQPPSAFGYEVLNNDPAIGLMVANGELKALRRLRRQLEDGAVARGWLDASEQG